MEGAACAAARLAGVASVVVVADREGDIHASFARCPAGVDLIVRAAQDRVLHDGTRLFAAPASWPELARTEVVVAPSRAGARGRIAKVVLRASSIVISRPRHGGDRSDPPQLTMHMVEAREIDGPAGVPPLLWRLTYYAKAIRDHWGIENRNHRVRDGFLGEDASKIRVNPGIVARRKSFALNLGRANGIDNIQHGFWLNLQNVASVCVMKGV